MKSLSKEELQFVVGGCIRLFGQGDQEGQSNMKRKLLVDDDAKCLVYMVHGFNISCYANCVLFINSKGLLNNFKKTNLETKEISKSCAYYIDFFNAIFNR